MHAKVARCRRKMYWKTVLNIKILKLALGEVLKKKGSNNGSGEGSEIQCDFLSIFVHFGSPFLDNFGIKMV